MKCLGFIKLLSLCLKCKGVYCMRVIEKTSSFIKHCANSEIMDMLLERVVGRDEREFPQRWQVLII